MASSDTTGDAAGRRLCPEVDLGANPSSLALLRCMGCAKVHIASTDAEESEGNIDKPKRCLKCLSVVYCGRECQRKDWVDGGHRKRCKTIIQLKDKLSAITETLRNQSLPSLIDNFWEVSETREYCHRRFALFDAIFSEATNRVWSSAEGTPSITLTNRLALELALEHVLDLLTLNTTDNMRIRCFLPSILIGLGKYHEAYGVIKYLFTNGDDICENERGEHANNLVCLVREKSDQDISEPLEALDLRDDSDVGTVFDLALIKFCIYHNTRNMQTLNRSELPNPDISTNVAGFFELSERWMDIDASGLFLQTKQLLSCVHHLNKHILPNLMDHRMLRLNPEAYAKQSFNEAALVIQRSAVWWKVNDFAHGFLRSFISDLKSQLVPFPLKQEERQMNLATMRGNTFERMNPRLAIELLGYDDEEDEEH